MLARVGRMGVRGNPGASLRVPTDIPSLLLWYDASDASYRTVAGSAVTDLADKSGNGHDLAQGTASFSPQLVAAGQNGLDYFSVDTNDGLVSDSIAHGIGTGDYTLVMCYQHRASGQGDWNGMAQFGSSSPDWYVSTGGNINKPNVNHGGQNPFATTLVAETDYVLVFRRESGGVGVWVNGNADASNPITISTSIADAAFTLLRGDTSSGMGGRFYEFLMYTKALSDSERIAMESYLTSKWGL